MHLGYSIQINLIKLRECHSYKSSELLISDGFLVLFSFKDLQKLVHIYNQFLMKNHNRQTSQQLKIFKHTTIEATPYRFQVAAKNFRKKGNPYQTGVNSSTNVAKYFQPHHRAEIKGSHVRSESKTKTSRKRSLQKFITNHRVTQRVSLNQHFHQGSNLSTKSKLMKINSIICGTMAGSGKYLMNDIYSRYDEYLALVKEWKNLDIFDQVDQFISLLIENYIKTIQYLLEETYNKIQFQLSQCQDTFQNLNKQNQKMKAEIQQIIDIENMILPIRQRLMEQYEKSQWSTFILNSLALQSFDLQGFIKQIPLYQKWVDPSAHQHLKKIIVSKGQKISTSNIFGQIKSKSEWHKNGSFGQSSLDYLQS